MITDSPDVFLQAFARLPLQAPACARGAFLVRPERFALAAESASDNAYMTSQDAVDAARAARQHAQLARALGSDVPVTVFSGAAGTPDAIFPNNVFATTAERFIVGRMRHPVRQREAANAAVRAHFAASGRELVDLSARGDLVAELTGVLVIDRARGVGFAGMSGRCDRAGVEAMHSAFGLELTFCFDLAPGEYHTNVVMALLASRAVILAAGGFADPAVPQAIARAYGDRVVRLDEGQKQAFAGNAITLAEDRVWMSARGAAALRSAQRDKLAAWGFAIGTVELDEIEKAGGSLRCCVAEIF